MNIFKDKMQDLICTCSEWKCAADWRSVTGRGSDCHSLWPVTFLRFLKHAHVRSACLSVGVELFNCFFLPRLPADDCWPGLNNSGGQWKTLPSPGFPNRSEYRTGKILWVILWHSVLYRRNVYWNMETQHCWKRCQFPKNWNLHLTRPVWAPLFSLQWGLANPNPNTQLTQNFS